MKYVYKKLRTMKYDTHTEHVYVVLDDMSNPELIGSQKTFKELDRVETFFNDKYNKPKMRKYRSKRK